MLWYCSEQEPTQPKIGARVKQASKQLYQEIIASYNLCCENQHGSAESLQLLLFHFENKSWKILRTGK